MSCEGAEAFYPPQGAPPMAPEVLEAMRQAALVGHNAASVHALGQRSRRGVFAARQRLTALCRLPKHQVVWCASAQEADALALLGRPAHLGSLRVVMVGHGDDARVQAQLADGLRHRGAQVLTTQDPEPSAAWETAQIWVVPVSCPLGGAMLPLAAIAERAVALGSHLHVQRAASWALGPPAWPEGVSVSATVDGAMLGGPTGIAALVAPRRPLLVPIWRGGGQQEGQRPGTVPRDLVAGMAEAATLRMACAPAEQGATGHLFVPLALDVARRVAQTLLDAGFDAGFGRRLGGPDGVTGVGVHIPTRQRAAVLARIAAAAKSAPLTNRC